jgi:hypothetical protein
MSKYCGTCGDGYLDMAVELKLAREDAQRLATENKKPYAVYKEKYTGIFKVADAATALAERYFVFEVVSGLPA